jgi:hypothetical protein
MLLYIGCLVEILMNCVKLILKSKIVVIALLVGFIPLSLAADWLQRYKAGEIRLIPDPQFGKDTEWEYLASKSSRNLAISKSGIIYISQMKSFHISMFDGNGKFLKKFAQKGHGPGDLFYPSNLSILDDRYLVVMEMTPHLRLSLFDLDGNFKDIVKVKHNIFHCIALKNNKVMWATVTKSYRLGRKTTTVFILDIITKRSIEIASYIEPIQKVKGYMLTTKTPLEAKLFYGRTKSGNLVLGYSNSSEIKIISPEGKLIHSFHIKMEREKITKKHKNAFFEIQIEDNWPAEAKRAVKAAFFPEYAPYYEGILVDSNGNILILHFNNSLNRNEKKKDRTNKRTFLVYNEQGKLLCESSFDFGKFFPEYSLFFYKDYLFGFLAYVDKDGYYRFTMIKSKLKM